LIEITNTETYGWQAAIRGMRNPMNSWDKTDSFLCPDDKIGCTHCPNYTDKDVISTCTIPNDMKFFVVGRNDLALMKTLAAAGSDHGKYLRMITVTADVIAPLYWWKEYDTYKVGTVANSCSTMHKLCAKEFVADDFSMSHVPIETARGYVDMLNWYRGEYLRTKDKHYWYALVQLLPESYNQKRTVQLNYAVLKNIYHSRKNHKLDEWHTFCDWIENLPYSELITE
jgi:hypothetical protein